ncbi:hypothetical protein HYQ44_011587 [Verticillium longisporum]|nr:hypothetical protein HYQ44_011587 [Verticillium longisporum]
MEGRGTIWAISLATCCLSVGSSTWARSMASARLRPLMSQPPMTRSLGWTMGRMSEKGMLTSFLVLVSVPSLMVELMMTEP